MFSLCTLLISLCYIVISVHIVTLVKTYQRLGGDIENTIGILIQRMVTVLLDDPIICDLPIKMIKIDEFLSNSLQSWENDWQMSFNPNKCEVIHITTKRKPIPNNYSIHGTVLNTTDHVRYIGVTISSNLSWKKTHINNITKKANSTMSYIRRSIWSSTSSAKSNAYKTYVRPTV